MDPGPKARFGVVENPNVPAPSGQKAGQKRQKAEGLLFSLNYAMILAQGKPVDGGLFHPEKGNAIPTASESPAP